MSRLWLELDRQRCSTHWTSAKSHNSLKNHLRFGGDFLDKSGQSVSLENDVDLFVDGFTAA